MRWKSTFDSMTLVMLVSSIGLLLAPGPLRPVESGASSIRPADKTTLTYLPFIVSPARPHAFIETFDGAPINPQPWQPANWDVTVHSRTWANLGSLTPMRADHGAQCEAPPATHPISTFAASVFICKGHMMTAINDGDYGVIYLTPDNLVDFSSGQAVIKFDVSTLRHSTRDWIDLWITPFADNLQLPLESWLPDLNGPPRRAIHIRMDSFFNQTSQVTPFKAEIYDNFNAQPVNGNTWTGYEQFLTPSATRRDTFELDLTPNHLKFGMPQYNFWWIDQDIPRLDWTQGVVQFGHHSYNPDKACHFDGTCGPNTWHWDNVSIVPAIPFTLDRATPRYVNAVTGPIATLAAPAAANAFLRFAGIGDSLEVSFNQGISWTPAQMQAQMKQVEEHFKSYWMPIPAGTLQVWFRGQPWWGGAGDWQVRDISVWSLQHN